ncbi:MAG: flagellar biosynthesis protein FlgD [Planctomycetes bacterium]|nr:flagellar biosynthesis protein FlgD [Planctomycetota bacterium]
MAISGISATDFLSGTTQAANQNMDKSAFMKLLVSQLQNQDPMSPVANEDFVAQLATFSSLEQLEGLNQNVVAMIALNQSNALLSQLTQSSALIGKEVTWQELDSEATHTGTVESVKIVDGLAVLRIDGQDVPLATVTEVLGLTQDPA